MTMHYLSHQTMKSNHKLDGVAKRPCYFLSSNIIQHSDAGLNSAIVPAHGQSLSTHGVSVLSAPAGEAACRLVITGDEGALPSSMSLPVLGFRREKALPKELRSCGEAENWRGPVPVVRLAADRRRRQS